MKIVLFTCSVVLVLGAACSSGGSPVVAGSPTPTTSTRVTAATVRVESNPTKGRILVDAAGMTLYHFDRDTDGTVACTGACATTWPPLVTRGTPTGISGLGTITRPEGSVQVTYKGRPLYRYSGDTKPGDTNGDGLSGLWHVVNP